MTVYYINGQSGSDGNGGESPNDAFRTFDFAIGEMSSGDKLIVYDDAIYTGNSNYFTIPSSKPNLTIEAAPGHSPIIDGEFNYPPTNDYTGIIEIRADYITLKGISVHRSNSFAIAVRRHHCVLDGVKTWRAENKGIGIRGTDIRLDGIVVRNCVVDRANEKGTGASIQIRDCDGPRVENSVCVRGGGEGISAINCTNAVWLNNLSYDNEKAQIYFDGVENGIIEGNIVVNTAANPLAGAPEGIVIGMEWSTYKVTQNIDCINNICVGNKYNIKVDGGHNDTDSDKGINSNWIFSGIKIANNTLIDATISALRISDADIDKAPYAGEGSDCWIFNNLVIQDIEKVWTFSSKNYPDPLLSDFIFSNNAYSQYPGSEINSRESNWVSIDASTDLVSSYLSQLGSIDDFDAANYKLARNSAAINSGTDSYNPPENDYFGQIRPHNNVKDIGFHEFLESLISNSIKSESVVGLPGPPDTSSICVRLSDSNKTSGGSFLDPYGGIGGWNAAVNESIGGGTIYLLEPVGGGDIILSNQLTINNKSGSYNNHIVIKPYPGHQIVISGGADRSFPGPCSTVPTELALVSFTNVGYLTIEDINIKNSGGEGLKIYNDSMRDDVILRRVTVTRSREGAIFVRNVTGLEFINCEFAYNDCHHNLIYPAIAESTPAVRISRVFNGNISLTRIHDNPGVGLMWDSAPFSVNQSSNPNVYNNTFYNNFGGNVYFLGMSRTDTKKFYRNVVYSAPDAWYLINYPDEFSGFSWRSSGLKILDLEPSFSWIDSARNDNWDIHDNIFAYNSIGLGIPGNQSPASYTRDVVIENNTFIHNDINFEIADSDWNFPTNNYLRNNVFVVGTGQKQTEGFIGEDSFYISDYNCWYQFDTGLGPSSFLIGLNDVTENPNLIDIPLYVNSGAIVVDDYVPSSILGSPLIDAGTNTAWTTDFFGNSRISGLFDIGFAESSSGSSPTNELYAASMRISSALETPVIFSPTTSNDLNANGLKSQPIVTLAALQYIDNNLVSNDLKIVSKLDRPEVYSTDEFGTIIQYKKAAVSYLSPQDYITISFDNPPQEGNLIIAVHYCGHGVVSQPSGFSVGFWLYQPIDNDKGGLYYKLAGPNESSVITATSTIPNEHCMIIMEIGGPWSSSPFDQEDHDLYATGDDPRIFNTSELSQSPNFVAGLVAGRKTGIGGEPGLSGGTFDPNFIPLSLSQSTYKFVDFAYKNINSAEPQSASWDANAPYADGHHGGIAIFKRLVIDSLSTLPMKSVSKLDRPTAGTVYSFGANSLKSIVGLESPYVGQAHALNADSISVESALQKPKLRLPSSEEALPVASVSRLGRPSIGQEHILQSNSVFILSEMDQAELGQTHNMSGNSIESYSILESPTATLIHALGANDVESKSKFSEPLLELIAKDSLTIIFVSFVLTLETQILSANSSIED